MSLPAAPPPARGLSRPVCRGGGRTGLGGRCAAATRLRGVQLQPARWGRLPPAKVSQSGDLRLRELHFFISFQPETLPKSSNKF